MDAPQYEQVDVPSGNFSQWKFYYKHHSDVDASQYVQLDA
jgi:hypothetical protein